MLRYNPFLFSILALLLCAFGLAPHAIAATLSLGSGSSATIGQTIQVPLLVSTEGSEVLNAVSVEIRFPAQLLTLQSISKTGSVMSFWAEEPSYSNSTGTASLQGIVPNPGWSGQNGNVVTLVFKIKASGTAIVSFSSASVLANDGLGTNILSKTNAKTLSLGDSAPQATSPSVVSGTPLAPTLTSSTHPDPNAWYNNNSPMFSWKVPADVTTVRLLYDKRPVSSPSVLYSPAIDHKQLSDVEDGTYYFHAQFQNANGRGAISHMRFQIDATPPKPFVIAVIHQSDVSNSQAIISFETTDITSGIDHYTVTVADAAPMTVQPSEAAKPYPLPVGKSGQQTVVVKAYDRAGNNTTDSTMLTIVAIESPIITTYDKQLKVGDPFTVSGTTYPGASVTVTIKNPSGITDTESAVADALGNFSLVWTKHLDANAYSFTAIAKNTIGATSLSTDALTFMVAGTPLAEWGNTALGYLLFAFVIIAVVAFVVGVGFILWYRLSRLRHRLKRIAIRSWRGDVQHDFDCVMSDFYSLVSLLHKANQERQLTEEENVILETLKHHLKKTKDDSLSRLEQIDDGTGE